MEIQEKKLKQILKSAIKEAIQEEKAFIHGVVAEAMEDYGIAKAIDEGSKSKKISQKEIYKILKAE
ncbi:MAG: hypothetical protein QME58_05575 [Bacteroidota bacterium]|nr:hypothetical protein [Bacteroidota bacterium]